MNCHHRPSLPIKPTHHQPYLGLHCCQAACVSASSKLLPDTVGQGVVGGGASQRIRMNLGPCISATLVARLRCLVVSIIATQACKSLLLQLDRARGPHPNPTCQEEESLGPSSMLPPQPHPCNIISQGNHELCRIRTQRKELQVEREYSPGGREPRYRGLQLRRPASEDTDLQSGDEQGHLGWQPADPGSQPGGSAPHSLCPSSVFPAKSP